MCYSTHDNMIINFLKNNQSLRKLFGKSIFTKDYVKLDRVNIGDFTYGKPEIYKWTNNYGLKIGKFCSIAKGVKIFVDGNHRTDWVSTFPFGEVINGIPKNPGHPTSRGDMEIGNDVWIGQEAMILSGVKIGDGAVIAAGSVVVKDVGDYEIVGGNPAKNIKFRFSPNQIEALKKIAWWNWELNKIKKEVSKIQSGDIDSFIKSHLT